MKAEALVGVDAPLAFSLTLFMYDRSGRQLVGSLGVRSAVVRDAPSMAGGRRLGIEPVSTLDPQTIAFRTTPVGPGDADVDASGTVPGSSRPRTDERRALSGLARGGQES